MMISLYQFERCLPDAILSNCVTLSSGLVTMASNERLREILVPAAEAVLILSAGGRTEAPAGLVTQNTDLTNAV